MTTAPHHLRDFRFSPTIELVAGGPLGAAFCSVGRVLRIRIGVCIFFLMCTQSADACTSSSSSSTSAAPTPTSSGLLSLLLSVLVDPPSELASLLHLFGMFLFLLSLPFLISLFLQPFRSCLLLQLFLLPRFLPLLFQPFA